MKVRIDFVSNSSSSSFMIVGSSFDDADIEDIYNNMFKSDGDTYDSIESCDAIDEILAKVKCQYGEDLTYYRGISDYYDMWCIGKTFDQMSEDETKKHFIDNISNVLTKLAGKEVKACAIIDGGYDG